MTIRHWILAVFTVSLLLLQACGGGDSEGEGTSIPELAVWDQSEWDNSNWQ